MMEIKILELNSLVDCKTPRDVALYSDAKDIECIDELNSQTGRHETRLLYSSDSTYNGKCVYVVIGKYEIDKVNKNIVTLKTKI